MQASGHMLTMPKKQSWLWLCLLMTLALVYWVNQSADEPMIEPMLVEHAPRTQRTPIQSAVAVSKLQKTSEIRAPSIQHFAWQRGHISGVATTPLFKMQSWEPPAPKPTPPPPPMAPAPPFTYMGSMEEMPTGKTVIFIQNKKVLICAMGSTITPQWRLDREDGQAIYLTYLPLNQAKVLSKTNKPGFSGLPASVPQDNHSQEVSVQ